MARNMYAFAPARAAPLTHRRQLALTGQRVFSRPSHPANVFSFWRFRSAAHHFPVNFSPGEGGPFAVQRPAVTWTSVAFSQFGWRTTGTSGCGGGKVLKDGVWARTATDGELSRLHAETGKPLSLDTVITFSFLFCLSEAHTFLELIFWDIFRILDRAFGHYSSPPSESLSFTLCTLKIIRYFDVSRARIAYGVKFLLQQRRKNSRRLYLTKPRIQ